MKAFLDTSSLVKLNHQERGSDIVMETLSRDVKDEECIFLTSDEILRTLLKKEKLHVA
jgi:hypothetical protein